MVRYAEDVKRVLFVCSQNKLRSPTAEQVFASWPGIEVCSAGLNHDAEDALTSEMVRDADLIFVMEKAHRNRLSKRFKADLGQARVICLDISDDYEFMDPELVKLLRARAASSAIGNPPTSLPPSATFAMFASRHFQQRPCIRRQTSSSRNSRPTRAAAR